MYNFPASLIPFILACSLAWGGCSADHTTSPDADGSSDSMHVYLLLGQSNMAGRGAVSAQDREAHPRVLALDKEGNWVPAVSPIHFDKPNVVGVGPGVAFGKALARRDSTVRIGLVPAAVGGSSIRSWTPGGVHEQTGTKPYDDALSRAHQALESGELKGILWYQGARDSRDSLRAASYQRRIVELVERLRSDLNSPDVPFVATRLAPFFVEETAHAQIVNEAIGDLPRRLDNVALVSTNGLEPKEDGLHLDAASSRELGRRYAETIARMQQSPKETGQ